MLKLQPGHGADVCEYIFVQPAPLTLLILEQVQRILLRRDNDSRVLGDPLQFLSVES
ncbi:hypothetical protein D3C86_2247360 [compost metagenome]